MFFIFLSERNLWYGFCVEFSSGAVHGKNDLRPAPGSGLAHGQSDTVIFEFRSARRSLYAMVQPHDRFPAIASQSQFQFVPEKLVAVRANAGQHEIIRELSKSLRYHMVAVELDP